MRARHIRAACRAKPRPICIAVDWIPTRRAGLEEAGLLSGIEEGYTGRLLGPQS